MRRPAGRLNLLLGVATAILASCHGSNGPAGTGTPLEERLVGDYTARIDSLGGITYWNRFATDGAQVGLTERDNGFRRISRESWVVEDERTGRILIGSRGYAASFSSGDSLLTLVSDHESDTIVYRREAGMPDPDDWVLEIAVVDEFEPPDMDPTDLAWDGTGLWFPGRFTGLPLRRLNPASGLAVDRTLPVTHGGYAVAYDHGNFWVDDVLDRRLYLMDGTTGATRLATMFVSPATIRGLAVAPDGRIWIGAGYSVTRFDPQGAVGIDSLVLYDSVNGLEALGPVLYVALASGGIARCEGPPWRVTATYVLPGVSVRGLAFDGADWWLYVIDLRGNVTTRIVRAKLLPTPLAGSESSPRHGGFASFPSLTMGSVGGHSD